MDKTRWWLLFGGAVLAVFVGFLLGWRLMINTWDLFDFAIQRGGNDPALLIRNLADATKGILGWLVFGLTMTNALIIGSSLSMVMMLSEKHKQ